MKKRPEIYEVTGFKFWDDPHISKGMLAAHLDPYLESATRKYDFIEKSVNWIKELITGEKEKNFWTLAAGLESMQNYLPKKDFR